MLHNKGMKFWGRVIDKLDSKELTEKDYSYVDSLENKIRTDADKRIMEFLDILIENSEQQENYFKKDMMTYVDEVYKGHADEEAMRAMRANRS